MFPVLGFPFFVFPTFVQFLAGWTVTNYAHGDRGDLKQKDEHARGQTLSRARF
jgi:hypothetical protein